MKSKKLHRPAGAMTVTRFAIVAGVDMLGNAVFSLRDTWRPKSNPIGAYESAELAAAFRDGLIFCEFPLVWGAWETVAENFERSKLEKVKKESTIS